MKILITGANGFVGKALCQTLFRQGLVVRAALRSTHLEVIANDNVIVGSIDGETDWFDALKEIDVVIHLAARAHVIQEHLVDSSADYHKVNVLGTLNLANQAANCGVKRFIFLSTTKVHGEQTFLGQPFNEEDVPSPQDNYGKSKFEAEAGLFSIAHKTTMEIVVIRPVLVYGSGVKANFASMLNVLQRRIPLPFGLVKNKRSLIYIDNLVSLIELCIDHPNAANQIFLASDDYDLSTPELLKACAVALGVKVRLLPVPQSCLMIIAKILGKEAVARRLCGSLQVDSSKARQMLGWQASVSLMEGLNTTVVSLRSSSLS